MERVDLPDVASWINDAASDSERQSCTDVACEGVAAALNWLFNLPAPPGAHIGLLEGVYTLAGSDPARRARSGCAYHLFFGDIRAPFRFMDALALQKYANKRPRSNERFESSQRCPPQHLPLEVPKHAVLLYHAVPLSDTTSRTFMTSRVVSIAWKTTCGSVKM